jgi:uncharacterized membrane protein
MNGNTWKFGWREAILATVGVVLYAAALVISSKFPPFASGNVVFRPEVAVLIFFGVMYGPWVGLLTGLIGSFAADTFGNWGTYWNWTIASGLTGLIAGLAAQRITDLHIWNGILKSILKAFGWGIAGILTGDLFGAITQKFVDGLAWDMAVRGLFLNTFLGHLVVTVILLPVLMVIFGLVTRWRN